MLEGSGGTFSSILHPTDFSASSQMAFEHALKIALANRSRFNIAHVEQDMGDKPDWREFPHIRETLESWGLLSKDSPRRDVGDQLGVHVKKVERISKKPLESIVRFLKTEQSDLIVLSTEGRDGLPRWLKPSFSEALLRQSLVPTLFVPAGLGRGFVSHENGEAYLSRILIATDNRPNPDVGIDVASGLVKSLRIETPATEALFIGDPAHRPAVHVPEAFRSSFQQMVRPGNPVEEILRRADEIQADLIVMITEGHHGFLDALRGSTTEQIVRRARCSVLAVPAA